VHKEVLEVKVHKETEAPKELKALRVQRVPQGKQARGDHKGLKEPKVR
jgi:hypothetical protein